ncbi:hypothetical protein LCGC14_0922360 [marine sediment metagenome]|uniref:PD-(D/E)XK nuclease superfamily protein n=1 Tax=marine sediment metagenome TaxID=412755 RepID=A0A0F9NQE1_9ZZZZ
MSAFLRDPIIEELELKLKAPNIFYILKFESAEIRHSNFLAWLLNPKGNHGLNDLFLKKFLKNIFSYQEYDWMDEFTIDTIELRVTEVKREWQHIDILIICTDFVVCIENKILSKEHSNQLTRYRKKVEKYYKGYNCAYVYLTPSGELPEKKEDREPYSVYSYYDISHSIKTILNIYSEMLNDKVVTYLEDYLTLIKREIMKEDELVDLVKKIYATHKDALDFIFENKPDRLIEVFPIFESKIGDSGWIMVSSSKGYIRFLTPQLNEIIPRKGEVLKNHESFMFEFEITPKRITFKTVIAPGEQEVRKILAEALYSLDKLPYYRIPTGKKWLVHFIRGFTFDLEESSDEELEKYLQDEVWKDINQIVQEVEIKILSISDDLKKYKK